MKRGALILVAALLFSVTTLSGQTPPDTAQRKVQISELQLMAGVSHMKTFPGTQQQFRTLIPGSEVLHNGYLSGFRDMEYYSFNYQPAFSALVGIRINRNEQKHHREGPVIRFGLFYNVGAQVTYKTQLTERYTVDTLLNSAFDPVGIIDSVKWRVYTMTYSTDQLLMDLSLVYSTTLRYRISLSGGVGISAGISTIANSEIEAFSREYEELFLYPGSHYSKDWDTEIHAERAKAAGNIAGTVYLPVGINYRLGGNNEAHRQIYLFYEARPGITIIKISGVDRFVSSGMYNGIGLRWSL